MHVYVCIFFIHISETSAFEYLSANHRTLEPMQSFSASNNTNNVGLDINHTSMLRASMSGTSTFFISKGLPLFGSFRQMFVNQCSK